jgi:hypothetical protein
LDCNGRGIAPIFAVVTHPDLRDSFDFKPERLPLLVAGLPDQLCQMFLNALFRSPFQACADLMVEVDLCTHLGKAIEIEHETFVPLGIGEALGSRFNPVILQQEEIDIPKHIFRPSRVVTIVAPGSGDDA